MAATTIKRIGYGQVEPNHLSAQKTGEIYAQLPTASTLTHLENGMFVKYDRYAGKINLTGDGEWMLVFNEIKHYNNEDSNLKDFVMDADNTYGDIVPRVLRINLGDYYTTNCVGAANTGKNATYAGIALEAGDKLVPGSAGFLIKPTANDWDAATYGFIVDKVTTMPDGQDAVSIRRIK